MYFAIYLENVGAADQELLISDKRSNLDSDYDVH